MLTTLPRSELGSGGSQRAPIVAAHGFQSDPVFGQDGMRELAAAIAALHPELRVPTHRLPGFVLYGAALFDKRVSFAYVRRNLHRKDSYSAPGQH